MEMVELCLDKNKQVTTVGPKVIDLGEGWREGNVGFQKRSHSETRANRVPLETCFEDLHQVFKKLVIVPLNIEKESW